MNGVPTPKELRKRQFEDNVRENIAGINTGKNN